MFLFYILFCQNPFIPSPPPRPGKYPSFIYASYVNIYLIFFPLRAYSFFKFCCPSSFVHFFVTNFVFFVSYCPGQGGTERCTFLYTVHLRYILYVFNVLTVQIRILDKRKRVMGYSDTEQKTHRVGRQQTKQTALK
jgi:hypothetical protein